MHKDAITPILETKVKIVTTAEFERHRQGLNTRIVPHTCYKLVKPQFYAIKNINA